MATSADGNGVMVIGGYNGEKMKRSKDLFEFRAGSKKWTPFVQKLQYDRSFPVVIPIPDSSTCTPWN